MHKNNSCCNIEWILKIVAAGCSTSRLIRWFILYKPSMMARSDFPYEVST
jgi:hypothetical protein